MCPVQRRIHEARAPKRLVYEACATAPATATGREISPRRQRATEWCACARPNNNAGSTKIPASGVPDSSSSGVITARNVHSSVRGAMTQLRRAIAIGTACQCHPVMPVNQRVAKEGEEQEERRPVPARSVLASRAVWTRGPMNKSMTKKSGKTNAGKNPSPRSPSHCAGLGPSDGSSCHRMPPERTRMTEMTRGEYILSAALASTRTV